MQIASYRDPELLPTIRDCVTKAAHPENLRFGICWQRDESEHLGEFADDPRFRFIAVSYRDSQGVGWARNSIQSLYCGETYTLQLDSHHRFIKSWDKVLIGMLRSLDSPKPLLTAYAPHYAPHTKRLPKSVPWGIAFDHFMTDGRLLTRPRFIDNHATLAAPLRARFYSAHFAFTLGDFCLEVKHDPQIYFTGEEIAIAVRAFTHGYDLYHPHKVIVWHEYTRNYRRKHWDDHDSEAAYPWYLRDGTSRTRVAALLGQGDPDVLRDGQFGLGTVRTLADYEEYAGINFKLHKVQEFTRRDNPPPNPEIYGPLDWETRCLRDFQANIHLDPDELPTLDGIDFWYFGIHDGAGTELFREDLMPDRIAQLLSQRSPKLQFRYRSLSEGVTWTVWPHSRAHGWLRKITGLIALGCFVLTQLLTSS